MVIYEAGPLEMTDGGRNQREAGMKLRERIGNSASLPANYKNSAFLQVMIPYLDGIF